MARATAARFRLQRAAAEHGWTRDGQGEHCLWTRGEERVSAWLRPPAARSSGPSSDSVPVEGRGRADAVLARFAEPAKEG